MMKILQSVLAAGALLLTNVGANALNPYTPPVFEESEWTFCGMGYYEPGVFDYFDGEYPEDIPCKMYKSVDNEKIIWVEPVVSDEIKAEIENAGQGLQPAGPFTINISDPDKVWTSPIWSMHPLIFCFYQAVPEILGIQGNDTNYGTLEGLRITFPKNSYICGSLPSGTPASNIYGNFAVNLPDPNGVGELNADGNVSTEFIDFSGMKVDVPQRGKMYIMKRGGKASKVVF